MLPLLFRKRELADGDVKNEGRSHTVYQVRIIRQHGWKTGVFEYPPVFQHRNAWAMVILSFDIESWRFNPRHRRIMQGTWRRCKATVSLLIDAMLLMHVISRNIPCGSFLHWRACKQSRVPWSKLTIVWNRPIWTSLWKRGRVSRSMHRTREPEISRGCGCARKSLTHNDAC